MDHVSSPSRSGSPGALSCLAARGPRTSSSLVTLACALAACAGEAAQSTTGGAPAATGSSPASEPAASASATASGTPSTSAPTSSPTASPAASPTASPTASAEPAETKVLTLEPRDLKVEGDVVLYEPNRMVKRASYDTYRFDKAHFIEKLGGTTLKAPKRVKVSMSPGKSATRAPSDPRLSAPVGGIEIRTYDCRIVGVE